MFKKNNYFILLALPLLIMVYQNCAPIHKANLGAESESSSSSALELLSLFEKSLHPVLKNNCASCHGTPQQPLFAGSDSALALQVIQEKNLMDLNFPENSRFVTKVMPGHNGHSTATALLIQEKIQEMIDGLANLNLDTTPPSLMISSPSSQSNLTGNVQITAIANDDKGIAGVQFYVDGIELGSEDTSNPYTAQWNVTNLSNGVYDLTARARDTSGNFKLSEIITVNVSNPTPDTQAPVISMTSPNNGLTVSGTTTLTAAASDNIVVAGVQFLLNGNNLGAEDTSSPYSFNWNTSSLANGTYNISARARDLAGNQTTSSNISIIVNNVVADTVAPTITITSPANGVTVTGTISVTGTASDNVGVVGVQLFADGVANGLEDNSSPYSISLNTASLSNGTHSIYLRARDTAGNITNSSSRSISVNNVVSDTTAPTINMTAPSNGSSINGFVSLTANANDNVGIAGVQFYINGSVFGSEDTTSPYSISWDTTTVSNGSFSISARARDTSGNLTTSTTITITVNNPDVTLPTVSITSPTQGTSVTGDINIVASANDNIGIVGVQFIVNGSSVGSEDTSAPYAYSWNTANLTNGSYSLTARARDAAGNSSTSATISVTVNNPVGNPNATFTWINSNILVPSCVKCHGPSKADAGVRYDTYTATIKTAKVGNLSGSKLYTTCNNGSMPAQAAKLSAVKIQAIADWITDGALNN